MSISRALLLLAALPTAWAYRIAQGDGKAEAEAAGDRKQQVEGSTFVSGLLPFVVHQEKLNTQQSSVLMQTTRDVENENKEHVDHQAGPVAGLPERNVAAGNVASLGSFGHFAWLHIPKTGTSFVNTLAALACNMQPNDTCVAPDFWPGFVQKNGSQPCLAQFAGLPFLYPPEWMQKAYNLPEREWHVPLSTDLVAKYSGALITMLRDPMKLKKSWYAHKVYNAWLYTKAKQSPMRWWFEHRRGLQVAMLTGVNVNYDFNITMQHVELAKQRLRNDFAFVGLSDRWAQSICLFHLTFGVDRCRPCEMKVTNDRASAEASGRRLHWKPVAKDKRFLDTYRDEFDENLLEEGIRLFDARREAFGLMDEKCKALGCTEEISTLGTW